MVMHDASMSKDAAITVRIPLQLKRRIEALARQERRSLSAQVATCLEENLASRTQEPAVEPARLLGLFEGARVPTDSELEEVRRLLWGGLGRSERGPRA